MEKNVEKLSYYSQIFESEQLSKAQLRQIEIVRTAIQCFSEHGIEKANFQMMATQLGVTRPLIQHYFSSKMDVFLMAVRLIRLEFQQFAVAALSQKKAPEEQFEAYVRSTFQWIRDFPDHAKTWSLFLVLCISHSELKALNQEFTRVGHERIEAMIQNILGESSSASPEEIKGCGHMVQSLITGALLSYLSDSHACLDALEKQCVSTCLHEVKRLDA